MTKTAIVVFPGSNRDRDMCRTIHKVTGTMPATVWHQATELPQADLVILPGGFSYGDYLRPGAIAACSPIMPALYQHVKRGGYILGVCNGFQILTEMRLLPGALIRNRKLKFSCRFVKLRVESDNNIFTANYKHNQLLNCPIAHHDGNYFATDHTLARLEDNGQIVLRYCNDAGEITSDSNPNGSVNNIAGISDDSGRIVGLMPHPENAVERACGSDDCIDFFKNCG